MKRSWQEDAVWFIWIKFLIVVDNLLGLLCFLLVVHEDIPFILTPGSLCCSCLSFISFWEIHVLFFISSVAVACIILSSRFNKFLFLSWKFVLFWLNCQCPTCTIEHIVLRHWLSLSFQTTTFDYSKETTPTSTKLSLLMYCCWITEHVPVDVDKNQGSYLLLKNYIHTLVPKAAISRSPFSSSGEQVKGNFVYHFM